MSSVYSGDGGGFNCPLLIVIADRSLVGCLTMLHIWAGRSLVLCTINTVDSFGSGREDSSERGRRIRVSDDDALLMAPKYQ